MTLSEMRQVLAAGDIQLTKSLGQNFLNDGNQLRRIVAAAELAPGDSVLEIGPGLGPLTALLLAREAKVLAIEKDGRLVSFLRAKFGGAPNLTLIHADALAYLRQQPADWSDWKLVANLPYSVVSAILIELAKAPQCPARLVTTVQLEVARRLMAQAGHADYGLLSLLVQLRYTVGSRSRRRASSRNRRWTPLASPSCAGRSRCWRRTRPGRSPGWSNAPFRNGAR
jgi:16S rRNA (adenine1518-N6/adenine1519-N6)-dimethyltransferase